MHNLKSWARWSGSWAFFLLTTAFSMVFAVSIGMTVLAEPTKPGDCTACHEAGAVLSPGHVPTVDMKREDCLTCHSNDTPMALQTKMPLSHFHSLSGVTCQACHGNTTEPQPLSTDQCLACHGPLEDLAARTADTKPHNPHSTPHGPAYAACDLCHLQHQPSENFCAQCHDFEYVVP